MKLLLPLLFLLFQAIILHSDKNWIPIAPINKTQTSKSTTHLDVNLSQVEPINDMIKNATVVKQLIDATRNKERPVTNDKNWFILHTEQSK